MLHNVTIYTDGACSGNPGVGGWGAILHCGKFEKRISGGELHTTNNRMELTAVIKALTCLKQKACVTLYSDSAYVVNAFTQGWIYAWQKNGWRTNGKKDVQNRDLWQELIQLSNLHEITFVKVKGHSDNHFNNECDRLAREAIRRL